MGNLIDARGLSCPQPVILTKKMLDHSPAPSRCEVLVDNKTAMENVTRFAENAGYTVSVADDSGDFHLTAVKK